MQLKQAREIAARVWCEPQMGHVEMDVDAAEHIAKIIERFPCVCEHEDPPCNARHEGWVCVRPVGHIGPHAACSIDNHWLDSWENDV